MEQRFIISKEPEWRKKVDFESLDSIPSLLSDSQGGANISDHINRMCLDPDFSPDEQEEKARLISQVRLCQYEYYITLAVEGPGAAEHFG